MKILSGKNQLLLLRLLYTNPQKSFYMQEIGKILGKKPGVFQRTLNALAAEGMLISEYRANARYFQANTHYPLYPEIKKIISKTVGVEGSLRELMEKVKEVKAAFIYGSFAKGSERADSDVDLLVIGSSDAEEKLTKEIPRLEKKMQREINYKLYSVQEFRHKRRKGDPFLEEVLTDKRVVLKGDADAV